MEHIETVTVGSGGAASITFMAVGDIPSEYTDLYLKVSGRCDRNVFSFSYVYLQFNGSSSGYTYRALAGSSVNSYSQATAGLTTAALIAGGVSQANNTASTFGSSGFYIPNYRSSVAKSVSVDGVSETNATDTTQQITAGLWSGTDAITSIEIKPWQSGTLFNWVEGTTASLYGIKKYNTGLAPKATGGIISFDAVNNKWVHAFTASGTFTPTANLSGVEYLVVAGGGGGGGNGNNQPGGGGAGGYRSSVIGESSGGGASAESTLSLTASTAYTVTVGAGGAGGIYNGALPTNGSNSVFSTITSTGGGYGSSLASPVVWQPANSGGSGGGGGPSLASVQTGGAGTINQGFAGGTAGDNAGSGGGGAGEAGNTDGAGSGGDGVSSSITGTAVVRGGGGATRGATAGDGGGGASDSAGTVNTGGGGGAGVTVNNGANGGSGIVIVRYSA